MADPAEKPADMPPADTVEMPDGDTPAADDTPDAPAAVYVVASTPDGDLLSESSEPPDDDTPVWRQGESIEQSVPFAIAVAAYGDDQVDVNLEPVPVSTQPAVTAAVAVDDIVEALDVLEPHVARIERQVAVVAALNSPPEAVFPCGLTESQVRRGLDGSDADAQAAVTAAMDAAWNPRLAPSAFATALFGDTPDDTDPIRDVWDDAAAAARRWQADRIAANPRV